MFGIDSSMAQAAVDRFMRTMEPMSSDDVTIMMGITYDNAYRFTNHLDPELAAARPLMTIEQFDEEIYYKNSGLYHAIRRFEVQQIYQRYGLSLKDYLANPREINFMLTDASMEQAKKIADEQERAKAEAHDREQAQKRETVPTMTELGPIVGPTATNKGEK